MVATLDRKTILSLGDKLPFSSAAREVGVRTKDFVTIYRTNGGKRKGSLGKKNPPPRKKIVEALKKMTNKEVAIHFKVGYKTLVRWLKHYNLLQHVMVNDLMSLAEAARLINVSRMTLSNWYRKGEVPGAVKLNETRVMVPKATVKMLVMLHNNEKCSK